MAPTAPHQRRPRRIGQIIPREHPEDVSKCRKWLLRVFLGCAGGKRQYYNKVIHGLRRDAQAHLSAKLTEKDTGRLVKRTRETLDSYLHRWLRDVAPMTRKPRTVSHDEENLRLYVRPYLGKYRLDQITPVHILVNDHGRKLYYDDDPKTDSSRRTLLVPEPALTKLKAWMLAAPEKLREPEAPVFHDPKRGGPLNERNLRRRHFRPLCRKAGVSGIRLYDLRHTFGSLMHRAKVPMKDYGEMMGHSSITVTADIYTHLDPEAQREAAEKFAAFLEAAATSTARSWGT